MARKLPKLNRIQILFLILTLAIMCTIFCLSNEDRAESGQTSSFITTLAMKIFHSNYKNEPPEIQQELWDKTDFIVRKIAHFTIYSALGFCASLTVGKRRLFSLKSLGVIIFGFIYAMSDEFHQSFVPGRSCEFRDMMIEMIEMRTSRIGMCHTKLSMEPKRISYNSALFQEVQEKFLNI